MLYKQNPFSLYDFLGYFAPGAIFLYALLTIDGHIDGGVSFQHTPQIFESIDKALIFILVSYLIGHVVGYLSSIFIEKYSNMAFGYPSKFLLGVRKKRMIEHFFYEDEFSEVPISTVVWFFSFPIFIWDMVLGKWLNFRQLYSKSLDFFLRKVIIQKINKLIRVEGLSIGSRKIRHYDFTRVVYHFVLERAHNHIPKFQNYVALYGFLRNMAFLSVLVFWIFIGHAMINTDIDFSEFIFLSTALSLFSYILFMSFVKFYRRYTLEVLMALVSIKILDNKEVCDDDPSNPPS